MKDVINNFSNIENYLIIIEELLYPQDFDAKTKESLQIKRLEWIFGFSFMNIISQNEYNCRQRVGLDSVGHNMGGSIYTY